MEYRMTFGDLNGSDQDRTDAIQDAINKAHANPRPDTLVLPEGKIEILDGLNYFVDGDTSAALSIKAAGGRSQGTILRCNGTGPTLKMGTASGGNFRRAPIQGITIQRRGIEFVNVGYSFYDDVCFHGVVGPCITATNSNILLGSGIVQHSGLFFKGKGGQILVSPIYQLGEDVGGFDLLGTHADIQCMISIGLKSAPETQVDINGNPFGPPVEGTTLNTVRPFIKAMDGSSVLIKGQNNLMAPHPDVPEHNICTTFLLTDRARDISFAAGARLHLAKATSLITTRIQQGSGTEQGAVCVIGDDVIVTSDLDAGQKFTVIDSLFGALGFDRPRFNGTVEVRDTSASGFAWSDGVAEGQGMITTFAQDRLNTD